jgi:hypothetical protein
MELLLPIGDSSDSLTSHWYRVLVPCKQHSTPTSSRHKAKPIKLMHGYTSYSISMGRKLKTQPDTTAAALL